MNKRPSVIVIPTQAATYNKYRVTYYSNGTHTRYYRSYEKACEAAYKYFDTYGANVYVDCMTVTERMHIEPPRDEPNTIEITSLDFHKEGK